MHRPYKGDMHSPWIAFHIDLSDLDEAMEDVALAYLLSVKFDAKLGTSGTVKGPYDATGIIRLDFKRPTHLEDAWSHYWTNTVDLDGDRAVVHNYIGALKRADPEFRESGRLLRKAEVAVEARRAELGSSDATEQE